MKASGSDEGSATSEEGQHAWAPDCGPRPGHEAGKEQSLIMAGVLAAPTEHFGNSGCLGSHGSPLVLKPKAPSASTPDAPVQAVPESISGGKSAPSCAADRTASRALHFDDAGELLLGAAAASAAGAQAALQPPCPAADSAHAPAGAGSEAGHLTSGQVSGVQHRSGPWSGEAGQEGGGAAAAAGASLARVAALRAERRRAQRSLTAMTAQQAALAARLEGALSENGALAAALLEQGREAGALGAAHAVLRQHLGAQVDAAALQHRGLHVDLEALQQQAWPAPLSLCIPFVHTCMRLTGLAVRWRC